MGQVGQERVRQRRTYLAHDVLVVRQRQAQVGDVPIVALTQQRREKLQLRNTVTSGCPVGGATEMAAPPLEEGGWGRGRGVAGRERAAHAGYCSALWLHATLGSRACSCCSPATCADLNGGEVFIELRVQRRKFIHGAVEDTVVVSEQLAQEEGGEGHVDHDPLRERTPAILGPRLGLQRWHPESHWHPLASSQVFSLDSATSLPSNTTECFLGSLERSPEGNRLGATQRGRGGQIPAPLLPALGT